MFKLFLKVKVFEYAINVFFENVIAKVSITEHGRYYVGQSIKMMVTMCMDPERFHTITYGDVHVVSVTPTTIQITYEHSIGNNLRGHTPEKTQFRVSNHRHKETILNCDIVKLNDEWTLR